MTAFYWKDESVKSRLVLELFAAGKPVPQPRAGPGKGGHMIMAKADHGIRGWRAMLRMLAHQAMIGKQPVEGPIRIEILFLFHRPKRLKDAPDMVLHDIKPDFDNVAKAVADSFKMLVWLDDGQVSTAVIRKRFAACNERVGVLVRVYRDQIPWK